MINYHQRCPNRAETATDDNRADRHNCGTIFDNDDCTRKRGGGTQAWEGHAGIFVAFAVPGIPNIISEDTKSKGCDS